MNFIDLIILLNLKIIFLLFVLIDIIKLGFTIIYLIIKLILKAI